MSIRIAHLNIKQAHSVKEYSYAENKNFPARQYMEDNFIAQDNFPVEKTGLFAILDGHGGAKVSEFCVDAIPRVFEEEYNKDKNQIRDIAKIIERVCERIDEELIKEKIEAEDVGTTCCIAFVRKQKNKRVCTIGNLGDTRAVIYQNGKARRVTTDHKGSSESQKKRIQSQGGCIFQGRVAGQLAITRALGDLGFKQIGLSNIPEIQEFQVNENTPFMIIASDGLWDVCEDQKAVELAKQLPSTKEITRTLMQHATKNGSKDNISVLAIKF